MRRPLLRALIAGLAFAAAAEGSAACTNTGSFERWLSEFKAEARASGISPGALSALDGVTLDQGIIARDRRERRLAKNFLQFSDRMAAKYRIDKGRQLISERKALFGKVEQQFGVPGSGDRILLGARNRFRSR